VIGNISAAKGIEKDHIVLAAVADQLADLNPGIADINLGFRIFDESEILLRGTDDDGVEFDDVDLRRGVIMPYRARERTSPQPDEQDAPRLGLMREAGHHQLVVMQGNRAGSAG